MKIILIIIFSYNIWEDDEDDYIEILDTNNSDSFDGEDNEEDDEDDEDEEYIPPFCREPYRVASYELFDSAEDVLNEVMAGRLALRRCEGLRMAYDSYALYVDGEVFILQKSWFSFVTLFMDGVSLIFETL